MRCLSVLVMALSVILHGAAAAAPEPGSATPADTFDYSRQEKYNPPLPAGLDTLKLPPAFFPALPANIKTYLEQRGIMIPQCWTRKRAHNVIRGQFTAPGSRDWAALCLMNDSIFILVFPQGDTAKPIELAREKVDKWEAHYFPGQTAFNRLLEVCSPADMIESYDFRIDYLNRCEKYYRMADYAEVDTNRIDHQGIVDSFIGLGEGYNYLTSEHNYLWELDYSKINYADSTITALHNLYTSFFATGFKGHDLFVPALDTMLLPPAYFRKLPNNIVHYLEQKKLMIPQHSWGGTAQNCVSGEFYCCGKTDWAVLCYKSGYSFVLVFKGGKTDFVEKILEEKTEIKSLIPPSWEFLRDLSVADTSIMQKVFSEYDEPNKTADMNPSHQGLVDTDVGDANYIYYHYKDKWQGPFFYSEWDE